MPRAALANTESLVAPSLVTQPARIITRIIDAVFISLLEGALKLQPVEHQPIKVTPFWIFGIRALRF